jgi:RNA polymerase sigma-70 factor (ECF subfamily)
MATTAQRRDFEALVASVHEPLMRYLRRRASAADADDVMGDVLLTLWRRLDDVPQVDPLPWCYGVARRALANHRRGSQRRGRLLERLRGQLPAAPVDLPGTDEEPELAAALAALPEADREVLVLWAWEQLEPREIATVLQITPNAVSVRLSRAKKKLARHMTRQDPAPSGHEGVGHTGEHRP